MTGRTALQRTGCRGALQIKPADWKENGHILVCISFSPFKRPQGGRVARQQAEIAPQMFGPQPFCVAKYLA